MASRPDQGKWAARKMPGAVRVLAVVLTVLTCGTMLQAVTGPPASADVLGRSGNLTSTATAVRQYSFAGRVVATRANDNTITWLVTQKNNAETLAIDASTQAVTRRYVDPLGNQRGGSTSWPDNTGFLAKTYDPATGLTQLGARAYDATTGRFLTVDPALNTSDAQSLAAYTYSDDDPVNLCDPSGLMLAANGGERPGNPGNPATPIPAPAGAAGNQSTMGAGTHIPAEHDAAAPPAHPAFVCGGRAGCMAITGTPGSMSGKTMLLGVTIGILTVANVVQVGCDPFTDGLEGATLVAESASIAADAASAETATTALADTALEATAGTAEEATAAAEDAGTAGRIGYHATKPEFEPAIRQGGFRQSVGGRLGGGGVYVSHDPETALAEYAYHNPEGPAPQLLRVLYHPGEEFLFDEAPAAPYVKGAMPPEWADTLTAPSLRNPGGWNSLVRGPLELLP